jgi:hypothetical protein
MSASAENKAETTCVRIPDRRNAQSTTFGCSLCDAVQGHWAHDTYAAVLARCMSTRNGRGHKPRPHFYCVFKLEFKFAIVGALASVKSFISASPQ